MIILLIQLSFNSFDNRKEFLHPNPKLESVFPKVHLYNHSCLPNVQWVCSDFKIKLVTLKPVQKGQELLLSYVGSLMDYQERRKILSEQYQFQCLCKLCLYEQKTGVFYSLHSSFLKKFAEKNEEDFNTYFELNFPLISRFERENMLCIRPLLGDRTSFSKEAQWKFNQDFFKENEGYFSMIGEQLLQGDSSQIISQGTSITVESGNFQIREQGDYSAKKTVLKQFLKEMRRIFGVRNCFTQKVFVKIEAECRLKGKPRSSFELGKAALKISKQFLYTSGQTSKLEYGLNCFKFSLLASKLAQLHYSFYFIKLAHQIMAPFLDQKQLQTLQKAIHSSKAKLAGQQLLEKYKQFQLDFHL